MQTLAPTITNIESAAYRIGKHINTTPVLTCQTINRLAEAALYFKCENFQKVGAFKFRGATNAVLSLSPSEALNGVATHSSGNHAQALALAAATRNTPAYIVMPENAPSVKVNAVKGYGGIITFCKPTLEARESTLASVIQETGATEIHPYNNFDVICGQATAAKELIAEIPGLNYIIAPVGGGGLLSGTALSTHYYSPNTTILAAEPSGADDAFRSLAAGKIIPSVHPNTIADGLLTSLGSLTFPIIQQYVKEILLADEADIIDAMHLIWERMKIIVEPSAAVPLAAILKKNRENKGYWNGKSIGIILSGGNIDLSQLPWQL